jgi:hypothetical protein
MRIFALSMISSLKMGKSRQPAVPASTRVVTPEEKVLTIGLRESFERECVSKQCACMSMMPGTTYLLETSTTFAFAGAEMPGRTSATLPSLISRSAGPSTLLAGSMTCPP